MLYTSTESTFDHARPFFLKLESVVLSISLLAIMPHVSLTPLKFIQNVCHAGHWVRYRGQRSHGHQLAFTKFKELISGLSFLRKKGFFICRCYYLLYSVTITSPFSLSLLGSWISTERSFLGNVCQFPVASSWGPLEVIWHPDCDVSL